MTETTLIPLEAVGRNGRRFGEVADRSPCDDCSAPCCRMVLSPHPNPSTFSELDYVRYLLGFPKTEMIVNRDGSWQYLTHTRCGFLDEGSRCGVHGTARKPKVCVYFDPYRCWYKRNFTTDDPPDIVRLDASRFETVIGACEFDDDGRLTAVPNWERIRALVPPPVAVGAPVVAVTAG